MKITIICDVLGEENNGTSVAAMNLIRYLKINNHEVKVVCADKFRENEEGFYIVDEMNFGKQLNKIVKRVGVTIAKANKEIILDAIKDAEIVHIMLPFSLGMTTVKLAKELDIPVTAGFHMMAQNLSSYLKLDNSQFTNKMIYKYIYNHFYQYVDAIHYPTNFIKSVFERNINKETNGYVISNGVNESIMKYNERKPINLKNKFIILNIGRYSKEKAQNILIKAIYHSKYKDKIQLIFAGHGLKENNYIKLSNKLPIKPIFKLYSRNEILNVINYSDMYIHTANIELEGIACLEAITCGKLTLVSDSKNSATKDFAVDNKCIFKHNNYKDLAKKIDYFIENTNERKKYEDLYLEKSSLYSQKECMGNMVKMFETIIKVKTSRPKTGC